MKKKPLFLVAFLIMSLCMIPSVTAGYGDESPQSITSFSETLPDDVMFSPDLAKNGTKVFASAGEGLPVSTGFLSNTYVDNIDNLGGYDTTSPTVASVSLNFTDIQSEAEGIYYYFSLYVHPYNDDADFWIWNYDTADWELLISNVPTGPAYYSDSLFSTDYISSGDVLFLFNGTTTGGDTVGCYIEYAYLSSLIMTLADEDHYAESFTDVSDWTNKTNMDYSSDGDVLIIEDDSAGGTEWNILYFNVSFTGFTGYIECYSRVNVTSGSHLIRLYEDGAATGDVVQYYLSETAGVWKTDKFHVQDVNFESVGIYYAVSGGISIKREYDYLQISPANESGYQHDCSTVAHTTTLRVDVESDGDHIQFQYSGGGGTGELSFHTDFGGSAIAAIDTDYYPFIGWNVVSLTDDYEVYVDNTLVYTGTGLGLQHINVKASGEAEYTTITFVLDTVTESMALDWVTGYSIANFTVSRSGSPAWTVNDYLYVDAGAVVSVLPNVGWMRLDYDPALSVTTETYNVWSATVDSGASDFRFREYVDSAWVFFDQGETRGVLSSGTLTGFMLYFYGDCTISAITFIDNHGWRGYTTVTVWFEAIAFVGSLNMLLIFGGLILIPASTLYAVKGGREAMNTDKLFYFLIAFIIGWALVIGGIYA